MRCFVALPLPREVRARIAEASRGLRSAWPELSWVRPENYHLTLAFLGEQGSRGVAAVRRALATLQESLSALLEDGEEGQGAAPADLPPYVFSPAGIGAFPRGGRGWRVLVLEPTPGSTGPLEGLHARFERCLAEEAAKDGLPPLDRDWPDADLPGSRPRRPFRAHLTLARARSDGEAPTLDPSPLGEVAREITETSLGGWPLKALALYKSELRSSGAAYTELDRVELVPEPHRFRRTV